MSRTDPIRVAVIGCGRMAGDLWELTSFFDWARDDTPPLFTGETGRANVAVAEAAYRSIASGKPEPV